MKTLTCLLGLVIANVALAEDVYYSRYPSRLIGDARVNISPLIEWWPRAESALARQNSRWTTNDERLLEARPLKAWVRIAGLPVATNGLGWVIDAKVYTSPRAVQQMKIVLKHPPSEEKAMFDGLKREHDFSKEQNSSAIGAASLNHSIGHEKYERGKLLETVGAASGNWNYYNAGQQAYAEGNQAYARAERMERLASQAGARVERAVIELGKMPKGDTYRVDFFALSTGQLYRDMPVYDLGFFVK